MKCLLLVCAIFIVAQNHGLERRTKPGYGFGDQDYGYVKVRYGTNLFWWLQFNMMTDKKVEDVPLILFLMGGPGSSATGSVNMEGIGTTRMDRTYRKENWAEKYNVLYVDSPVGAGYSYVESDDLYATDNLQIATDLMKLMHSFLEEHPEFKSTPFYIYTCSYGARMGVDFAVLLYQAIKKNEIKCNFKGIVLGNGSISTLKILDSFSRFYYIYGLIDRNMTSRLEADYEQVKMYSDLGVWKDATEKMQSFLSNAKEMTDHIDDMFVNRKVHKSQFGIDPLIRLMNGEVKKTLNIPENVIWKSQEKNVIPNIFDMMVPKFKLVQYMLNETPIQIHVVVSTSDGNAPPSSILEWVNELQWPGKKDFELAPRKFIWNNGIHEGYSKNIDGFGCYWLLGAGHLSFMDNPNGTLAILSKMIGQ